MGHPVLERGLLAVRDGRETFDSFARRTMPHWERLAQYILRRWRQPAWVSDADVVQDLLVAAYDAVWTYDPSKGPTIEGYAVYSAVDHAKKRAHKARGAKLHRTADRNPSRMELGTVTLWGEDAPRRVEEALQQEPTQEDALTQREALQRARAVCRSEGERCVIRTLAQAADLVEGAMMLYADPEARLACRLLNETHAARVTTEVVLEVAERLQDGAAA
jgi:DNA-directed RNA polymerase specialized sigma24 family protein